MRRTAFVGIILLVLCTGAAVAADIPPLPAQYFGTVSVNGQPAQAGTTITAVIGSEVLGSLTITEAGKLGESGTFGAKLLAAPASSTAEGKSVSFLIGTSTAAEKVSFVSGDAREISLTFAGVAVPTSQTPVERSASSDSDTGGRSSASPTEAAVTVKTAAPTAVIPSQPTVTMMTQTKTPASVVSSVPSEPVTGQTQALTETPTSTQKASVPLFGLIIGVCAGLLRARRTA